MAQKMFTKVIVSGDIIEVYEYEGPVFFDFKKRKKAEEVEVEDDMSIHLDWEDNPDPAEIPEDIPENIRHLFERKKEYRKSAMYRARQTLRRLILSNFDKNSKFVTLTFRDGETEDIKDVRQTNPMFKRFIQRLNRYLKKEGKPALKYAVVVEFQDKNGRGAVHYHMICNLDWMPHEKLTEIWRHGWVGINSLKAKMREDGKDVDNVGAYMIKYMLKDFNDERLRGQKTYWTSRGLIKPIEYKGMDAEAFMYIRKVNEMKEVFTSEYESEYHGKIQYREFNLKRCIDRTAE